MIPSLVVTEIRDALVEFLSSTFALSNDDVRDALSDFLRDESDGIFRGPYLSVRTPFRQVEPGWEAPLEWLPDGFLPYQHQATAFERLSTLDGRTPSPTLVTTGTGSGKTECFLMPVLDHCARTREKPGIKALILYPMNALASDQAGRIAETIAEEARLAGITAGLYVGEQGRHTSMSAENIIDNREALRADPPDILLTNYKMLDFLLLRAEDRDLWAVNEPDTLQYVVLDEFHTYDGAQGTDVAMLLRRLGATLGMATPDCPLGTATPVATSATLGSSPDALVELRSFAEKVFGADFDETSVIGETRQTVEEACDETVFLYPIPEIDEFDEAHDFDDIAALFCSKPDEPFTGGSPVELGEILLKHPLTRAVLTAVGRRPRSWTDALAEIVAFAPNWGRAIATGNADGVERALTQYLRLLSYARRDQNGRHRPLFSIEVQLWIREISRLLRRVEDDPVRFRWRDSASVTDDDERPVVAGEELPAVYCRRCGMSGWMALAQENSDALNVNPSSIYNGTFGRSPLVRTLLRAHPDDPARSWYSPSERRIVDDAEDRVPVLITAGEDDAKANRCPACSERDAIRYLGLQVASLASVSINTLFGSEHLDSNERKLLAFTDSVQDASHRASFFGGRTHRINLRSLMANAIREAGELTLADLGDELMASASDPSAIFGLVPPDLVRHPEVKKTWTDEPPAHALDLLAQRIGFEADLEFGLRSRVGRTLELARVAAARVEVREFDGIASLIAEECQRLTGEPVRAADVAVYLRGLLERMRLKGGLDHPLLEPYINSGGKSWFIWGGRPDGLPPFTQDQGRPDFFTTAAKSDLATITAVPGATPTWIVDWASRTLGLERTEARNLNQFALGLLAKESDAVRAASDGAGTVYSLDRRSVVLHDIQDIDAAGAPAASQVACGMCGHVMAAPPHLLDAWTDSPCLRYRCGGSFERSDPWGAHYYRSLYRSGQTRRVVTGEHTGLLGRRDREDLERAFKTGTAPDAPNVLTATPTLEMGIDIGDLSAVMLTSVPRNPASYIQRVGRAGRSSGNSLVTTFVKTDTHGLYFLAEPQAMISGDVRPPSCFLDAIETLQRQYVAYLVDRAATHEIEAPLIPRQIGQLAKTGLDDGGFLRAIVDASVGSAEHIERFLALFGDRLTDNTMAKLRDFAGSGIEIEVKQAIEGWEAERKELDLRRSRLTAAIDRVDQSGDSGPDHELELSSLRGQRKAVVDLLQGLRNEYSLSALERIGLLPNYNLIDDSVTLSATMWSKDDAGNYETEIVDFQRSGRMAIREFAPGNSFYASGHRHQITALEVGSAQEPLYERWRLCPDCGFAAIEVESEPLKVCPRCASQGMGDTGSLHTMLRLRTAMANASEESARVFDESDDRRQERYSMAQPIDVDPASVSSAWELSARAFGAEFVGRMHLRTINLGLADKPGENRAIAGAAHFVSPYQVCDQCGAVATVRDDNQGQNPERLHQGWCKVRSGNLKEQWSDLLLFHELTTEAIRLALPVSMFEVEERLVSFKAALLLGLREDFGGNPDHLEVALSDSPNRGGQGRRRFLLLFDAVPGGTGYLAEMADPARLRALLESGRDVIARCPCTGEGRPACHRCVLGVVSRNEYDHARRDLAMEMLDDLLGEWEPSPVPTIGEMDLGKVEESELERRFKVALRDWAEKHPNENISWQTVPGNDGYAAFELRLEHNGERLRYRIDEQAGLSTTPSTIPDFLIRRMDTKAPEVAVYLDGLAFHASPENNNIAADAEKRRAVRSDGRLVWNLMWDDVNAFHTAALKDPQVTPTIRTLIKGKARRQAQNLQHARDGQFDVDALNQNPMALLIDFLARPDVEEWRRLVLSACGGLAAEAGAAPSPADDVAGVVRTAIAGHEPNAGAGELMVARYVTPDDLPITLVLDARNGRGNDERWTVVSSLDDSLSGDHDAHVRRWKDWLHWNNVLQFLGGPGTHGRDAVLCATSERDTFPVENLWIVDLAGAAAEPSGPVELSDDVLEELELIDPDVEPLVRAALLAGCADVAVGAEVEGFPLEAAWVGQKVAVLLPDDEWSAPGWDARSVDEWTAEELIAVIEERT